MIKNMRQLFIVAVLLVSLQSKRTFAQPQLTISSFITGMDKPVGVYHCGDERLFIVEQTGRIWISDLQGNLNSNPFLNISSLVTPTGNERGLLGLAFHPDYFSNGYFFLNYTDLSGNTVIARYSVSTTNPDSADENSGQSILNITQPYANHNGGQIVFGKDSLLYIGMGDGGSAGDPQGYGQNTQTLLGKMLRIDIDSFPYAIPADNPFVNSSTVLPEIWAIGMRNPWRFSFDRLTGDLWIGDVGQDAREEIDFEPDSSSGGLNYGWRCYEGNNSYNTSGCNSSSSYVFPIYDYANNSITGCSVTGGYVYRGIKFPGLYGYYLHTDYCSGIIWGSFQDSPLYFTTTNLGTFDMYDYASFGEDKYGELYLAGRNSGIIYRISDSSVCAPFSILAEANDTLSGCEAQGLILHASFHPDLSYQWLYNSQPIIGQILDSLSTDSSGIYQVIVSNGICADTSEIASISIHPNPVITISGLDTLYCFMGPVDSFTFLPTGGIFTGNIGNGFFDPSVAPVGLNPVSYSYTDSLGCTAIWIDTIEVEVCLGTGDNRLLENIRIFPNPAKDYLYLTIPGNQFFPLEIIITDIQGKIFLKNKNIEEGPESIKIPLLDFSSGIYFVSVKTGDNLFATWRIEINK
jgi:glucose/arabinose dehydrogenase